MYVYIYTHYINLQILVCYGNIHLIFFLFLNVQSRKLFQIEAKSVSVIKN